MGKQQRPCSTIVLGRREAEGPRGGSPGPVLAGDRDVGTEGAAGEEELLGKKKKKIPHELKETLQDE